MKISTFLSCSALFLASLAVAAPDDPNKIDTCTKPGVVAWTIDDGPGMYNDQLLAIMAKKNVTATFFVLGTMIDQNAAQAGALKKILAGGHQLASHTYSHGNLDNMTVDQMKKEVSTTSDTMFKHSGVRPRYMRAPEGRCGVECTKVMTDLGLVISHWNVDTNDWRFMNEKEPLKATEKSMVEVNDLIINNSDPAKDSFILLQHEIHKFSVEHLADRVIDSILKKGYRFVSMEECVGEKAYLEGSVLPSTAGTSTTASATTATMTTTATATATTATTASKEQNNAGAMAQVAAWTMGLTAALGCALI
ncbi:hypothetical protein BG006_005950 [Podila minutissima]|uniref:NodB homology domain-containing protein n=1 Tax=Podila minutissima TaxID=64525 RepID=A0A9P5SJQ1_9FUNG|nr:hypothetical protein BG006_005950 [Podila minutissima]